MEPEDQQLIAERLQAVLAKYSGEASELIPVLQAAQAEIGYLPPESRAAIATFLKVPESTVYGVATFYSQFYMTPRGRHTIKVCLGTACHVRGATQIVNAISDKLGINPGETTDDFEFSVEGVACFGSCALAPVVVVNGKVYGNCTPTKIVKILGKLS